MLSTFKEAISQQFGASIQMLENAIVMCPAEKWDTADTFWYSAYHCLFFLDYYLTEDTTNFAPPQPFTLSEFEDRMPNRAYTKNELLEYLDYNRGRCLPLIDNLTEVNCKVRWLNESRTMDYSRIEILLYNMRHVQHHAAQLNLLLRQGIDDAPQWVARAKEV